MNQDIGNDLANLARLFDTLGEDDEQKVGKKVDEEEGNEEEGDEEGEEQEEGEGEDEE
jgi:hypothetical protein